MKLRYIFLLPKNMNKLTDAFAVYYSKKFPSWFAVDNKKLTPHITLFDATQNSKKSKKIESELIKFLKNQKSITLKINGIDIESNGTFELKILPSKTLLNFRRKFHNFIKRHGYKITSQRIYNPHITLTRYKNVKHAKLLLNSLNKAEKKLTKSFKVNTIAIGLCNKLGQFSKSKILFRFKLKK